MSAVIDEKLVVFSEVLEKEVDNKMQRVVRIIFYSPATKQAHEEEVIIRKLSS